MSLSKAGPPNYHIPIIRPAKVRPILIAKPKPSVRHEIEISGREAAQTSTRNTVLFASYRQVSNF